VINSSGTGVARYRYDAFGTPATIYSSINNRFLFTGREYNQTFGFYEYRARAYHPTLGRFMSEDPKGFDAGDYNLFRYCANDPEDRTDPMGLDGSVGEQMMRNRHLEAIIGIYDTETGSHIPRPTGTYAVMRLDSQDLHMGQVSHATPNQDAKKFQRNFYKEYGPAWNKVKNQVMGRDEKNIPDQALRNAPNLDVSHTSREVAAIANRQGEAERGRS
jgi:RHS repeat-associated protein